MSKRFSAWGLMLALLSASLGARAQEAPPALKLHSINKQIHWVEGGGGNSGIVIGRQGVIVIDAKTTAQQGEELVTLVSNLTSKPITHVILTHSDGDHVNGLAGFPQGLQVIAHKNNKVEQLATLQLAVAEVGGGKCLPPADRLPNSIVFEDRVSLTIDGVRIVLHHFGPSHTNGDLVVELPEFRLAFVGDLITDRLLIHPEKSGTLAGWLTTSDRLVAMDVDTYVGGHSSTLDTKASLRRRVDEYRAVQKKVNALVDAGMSLPDVKTAMGDPVKDPSGCRGIPWPSLSTVAFHERLDRNAELRSDTPGK
jgi:cyclase